MNKKAQSKIDTALKRCRAAFAACPQATYAWCCHHEVLAERLFEPAEVRIAYILDHKPPEEHAIRFDNFRPVKDMVRFEAAYNKYDALLDVAQNAYNLVVDPARATYQAVRDAAWSKYEVALDQLRLDRDAGTLSETECDARTRAFYATSQTTVIEPAWAVYQGVCGTAKIAYHKAITIALKKHMRKLYLKEVPRGTWTGTSIF